MRASSLTNLGVASDYYIDSDYDKVLQVAAVTQEIQQLAPYADAVGVVADDISSVTSVAQAVEDGIVGVFKADDRVKLDGIETEATADQTGSEIKALYEAEANTNAFTDAEKTKLASTEITSQLNTRDINNRDRANHTGTQTLDTITETTTKKIMTNVERTKLAGIEAGATGDQTGAEIKALYEAQTGKILDNVTRVGLNGTSDIGRLVWNADEQTADLKLNSDVTLQLGQEELVLVKNSTGATIANGKVVMVVGSNGNSGNLLVALHDGTKANAVPTLGITTQDIANGASGFVTKSGKVRGINTSGSAVGETWVDGDVLYVSTNGNLTKVVPGDTGLKMSIAVVINAHGSNGTLFVRTNGLDENHDKDWTTALVTTHTSNVSNPHAVTKAQVGLGNVDNTSDVNKPVSTAAQTALNLKANLASPTFTGTVSGITKAMVGLGSVDNTADSAKVVASAAKLTTARTIGGVSFDGMANINLPGVNTAGNQSTTGNAATATKLQTARTINGVAFDGSANITVSDSTKVAKTGDTGSAKLPVGTTAQRDAVPLEGMIRYNSTTLGFEGYSNGMWQPIAVKNDTKKRRNYLINGNFQFWDYATSQTSSGYGSDNRWVNEGIGSTKINSRMTSGDTERALFESSYYSRTVVSSVVGSGNYLAKLQRIEDITKLAGKTVTLSFWAKADSSKNIAIEFAQNFGTGGSPSAVVYAINPTIINLTTTWKKYSVTTTLPSLVGKTLGTDGVHTSYTGSNFLFDAGSNFNPRTNNLGQQSGTFDIAEVKLEDGSVATEGWAPYDGEWGSEAIARMRYYEIIKCGFIGPVVTSSVSYGGVFKLIHKRTTPSVAYLSDGNHLNFASGVLPNLWEVGLLSIGAHKNNSTASGQGYWYTYVAVSAEL